MYWGEGKEVKSKEISSNLHFSVALVGTVCEKTDQEDRDNIQRVLVMTMSVKKSQEMSLNVF